MSTIKRVSWGAVLALAALSAGAQTGTTAPTAQQPEGVGVSPQTAQEATQKAIPRSDTGTVVRTEPSAAEQTRSAAENATTDTSRSASGSVDTDTSRTATAPGVSGDMRTARADRN